MEYMMSGELRPADSSISPESQLTGLVHELILQLETNPAGIVAFAGFLHSGGEKSLLKEQLDSMMIEELKRTGIFRVLSGYPVARILVEKGLSFPDLLDTATALDIAEGLEADYIVIGSIIEMTDSVIVFGRVLSGEISSPVSAAQIILSRSDEVNVLLPEE